MSDVMGWSSTIGDVTGVVQNAHPEHFTLTYRPQGTRQQSMHIHTRDIDAVVRVLTSVKERIEGPAEIEGRYVDKELSGVVYTVARAKEGSETYSVRWDDVWEEGKRVLHGGGHFLPFEEIVGLIARGSFVREG
jgi:hypothetical protein